MVKAKKAHMTAACAGNGYGNYDLADDKKQEHKTMLSKWDKFDEAEQDRRVNQIRPKLLHFLFFARHWCDVSQFLFDILEYICLYRYI